jgi:hypothetical protein
MAPAVTRSDVNALEHILTVLLGQAVPTTTTLTPFRSCFSTAGVTNASDFVSMDAPAYGAILFPLITDGTADQQLNVILWKIQCVPNLCQTVKLNFATYTN